jgi:serine/threonine protein kinase
MDDDDDGAGGLTVDAETDTDEGPSDAGSASSRDTIDLASFLEFAVSAAHALETLHKAGLIHREVRPNAFHVNVHSGAVRFAHFGNRSVSLERLGGPSSLVIEAGELPERKQRKVKEAMCYLAPEQTGTAETVAEDHRTDLYALGVLFWTLLVGHGRLPFEGSAMELLHSVVQRRPASVHEVRRDVPEVVSKVVDKVALRRSVVVVCSLIDLTHTTVSRLSQLLVKSPDGRYNSAVGLKNDLMECQKRLTLSCASTSTSMELIPPFEIGQHDMFLELTIPTTLVCTTSPNFHNLTYIFHLVRP